MEHPLVVAIDRLSQTMDKLGEDTRLIVVFNEDGEIDARMNIVERGRTRLIATGQGNSLAAALLMLDAGLLDTLEGGS